MPEPTKDVPGAGVTGSTAGGGQTDQTKGGASEEASKKLAELQTQLEAKEKDRANLEKVLGQQAEEVSELRQFKQKFGPHQEKLEKVIASEDRRTHIEKQIADLSEGLGEDNTNKLLGLIEFVRTEDLRAFQSKIDALGEQVLLLKKPDYQFLNEDVKLLEQEILKNPAKAKEVIYEAAKMKNLPKILEEEKKKWEATETERLKKEALANLEAGLTGPPGKTPEEEAEDKQTQDSILAYSRTDKPAPFR